MEAMETMIALAKGDEQTITDIKEKQLIGFELILFFLPLRVQICFYTVTVEQICFIEVACLMKRKAA